MNRYSLWQRSKGRVFFWVAILALLIAGGRLASLAGAFEAKSDVLMWQIIEVSAVIVGGVFIVLMVLEGVREREEDRDRKTRDVHIHAMRARLKQRVS